jgi:metal-dependent amidase/aminoacylase/carboxypeptidase family protein
MARIAREIAALPTGAAGHFHGPKDPASARSATSAAESALTQANAAARRQDNEHQSRVLNLGAAGRCVTPDWTQ